MKSHYRVTSSLLVTILRQARGMGVIEEKPFRATSPLLILGSDTLVTISLSAGLTAENWRLSDGWSMVFCFALPNYWGSFPGKNEWQQIEVSLSLLSLTSFSPLYSTSPVYILSLTDPISRTFWKPWPTKPCMCMRLLKWFNLQIIYTRTHCEHWPCWALAFVCLYLLY